MPSYTENVVQALARQLGVPAREIVLAHDLYRDWGLTPLSLVSVLLELELERSVALELPSEELAQVRTVRELVTKFRGWIHDMTRRAACARTATRAGFAQRPEQAAHSPRTASPDLARARREGRRGPRSA